MKRVTCLLLLIASAFLSATALRADALNLPFTPVTYYADGADLDAFFHVTLFNVPNGFSVQDDLYLGWCVTLNAPSSPTGFNHTALLLDSTSSNLPSPLSNIRWDLVNYILNHKQGDADEIQCAIWLITDNSTILPITANVQAMITDALNNGTGFTPFNGQIAAAIVVATDDLSIQTIVIEVPTPTANECEDRFTSGGFIYTTSGAKGTFGCHAGVLNGAFWAGLNYVDHGTGLHVQCKTITNYEILDDVTRRATFIADADGVPVIAVVTVADNGEPGSKDTFQIVLSNGYSQGGQLGSETKNGGGNVQLHKPKCKNAKNDSKIK